MAYDNADARAAARIGCGAGLLAAAVLTFLVLLDAPGDPVRPRPAPFLWRHGRLIASWLGLPLVMATGVGLLVMRKHRS